MELHGSDMFFPSFLQENQVMSENNNNIKIVDEFDPNASFDSAYNYSKEIRTDDINNIDSVDSSNNFDFVDDFDPYESLDSAFNLSNEIKTEEINDIDSIQSSINPDPDYEELIRIDEINTDYCNSSVLLKCHYPLCAYETINKLSFKNHCSSHSKKDNFPITCNFCFKKFKTDSVCKDHIRQKHYVSTSRKYLCEFCGQFVATYKKNHICNLPKNKNKTPVHFKSVKTKKLNVKNNGSNFHCCDFCDYTSKRLFDVKRHQSTHNDVIFFCEEKDCTFQCKKECTLILHNNVHLKYASKDERERGFLLNIFSDVVRNNKISLI